jgi:hypothetical protein
MPSVIPGVPGGFVERLTSVLPLTLAAGALCLRHLRAPRRTRGDEGSAALASGEISAEQELRGSLRQAMQQLSREEVGARDLRDELHDLRQELDQQRRQVSAPPPPTCVCACVRAPALFWGEGEGGRGLHRGRDPHCKPHAHPLGTPPCLRCPTLAYRAVQAVRAAAEHGARAQRRQHQVRERQRQRQAFFGRRVRCSVPLFCSLRRALSVEAARLRDYSNELIYTMVMYGISPDAVKKFSPRKQAVSGQQAAAFSPAVSPVRRSPERGGGQPEQQQQQQQHQQQGEGEEGVEGAESKLVSTGWRAGAETETRAL